MATIYEDILAIEHTIRLAANRAAKPCVAYPIAPLLNDVLEALRTLRTRIIREQETTRKEN